jgi:hypothetical protein
MAEGRTKVKHWRCYVDGYDLSGYSRSIGPLETTYDEADLTAYMGDAVKGYLPNTAHVNLGTLNAVLDNTAVTGLHTLMATAGIARDVLVPIGIRANPADGDPCFGGVFLDKAYQVTEDGGAVTVTIPWSGWADDAGTLLYASPWGTLLHAKAQRVVADPVNDQPGFDNPSGMVATEFGGYFVYHVFDGDGGNLTLFVEDAAAPNIDGSFAPLVGATSGLITADPGVSGLVALDADAEVRQYLRWQIAFGTSVNVTFACAFMRRYDQT